MKPEPLKGKGRPICNCSNCSNDKERFVYHHFHIASAVEWFQLELRIIPPELSKKDFQIQLAHIIGVAFEDVMK